MSGRAGAAAAAGGIVVELLEMWNRIFELLEMWNRIVELLEMWNRNSSFVKIVRLELNPGGSPPRRPEALLTATPIP